MGICQKKNENKYLIFAANEKKELLKKYTDVWDKIKNEIKTINDNEQNDYKKDYLKLRFNSDDDLRLNKPIMFHKMTIIITFAFQEDRKWYPWFILDEALCNEI